MKWQLALALRTSAVVPVVAVVAVLAGAGCGNGNAPKPPPTTGGNGGRIFDPCVAEPLPGYDPASQNLPACCTNTGPAHCVPNDQVLPTLQMALTACDASSVCMPDPIIKGGGQYSPPSCTSSLGSSPGVCLSQCIPLVANNKQAAFLGQDGCGDAELCVPCKSPLDGTTTGACELNALLCGGLDMGGGGGDGGVTCPYTGPPIIKPETLPACAPACGGAHCLPASVVPPGQQSLLSACTAADGGPGYCAPDPLIASAGNFVPKSCTSVAGAEGRCMSTCLPSVAEQAALLPRDVCAFEEKCAPCFNPTASDPTAPTGACTLACDHPVKPPVILSCPWTGPPLVDPKLFPACAPACGGAHCVPTSLVPAAEQPLLAACNGGKGLCAPDKIIVAAGNAPPKSCTSIAGAEGRCTSKCLPSVAELASLLPVDNCDAGEVCAPCFNPTAGDPTAATGACTIGCDKPTQPPLLLECPWTGPPVIDAKKFPACAPACGGAHCVPKALVPQDEQSLLASCNGGKGLCAPDPIITSANHFVPPTCTSVAGAEGRCMSTCLPDIAKQAALLPQDVCAANERCAPCFNPTASDPTAATGACSLGCDMPQKPPVVLSCPYSGPPVVDPTRFENCTSATCSNAHCIPDALVPPEQRGILAPCLGGGFCTPDPIITSADHWVPPRCTSIAGAEGRCMSTCLPSVAAQASLLPTAGCDAGTVCVPCFNPMAGDPTAATGACSLACDAPTAPPVVLMCPWAGPAVMDPARLPACSPACGGAHCLPKALVPPSQAGLLVECNSGTGYCTPDPIIATANNFVPKTCNSIAGAEGRCLSRCLPMVAGLGNLLPQAVCASNEKCVPCFNPTAQDPRAPTGACGLACDRPARPPTLLTCPWNGKPAVIDPAVLPGCDPGCGGAHCLPAEYVPAGQRGLLQPCAGGYCAPDPLIATAGNYKPPTCTAFAGVPWAEGRCLSACLPSVASQPSLEQSTCPGGEKCAPCTDPFSGAQTGACAISSCDAPAQPPYTFTNCCFSGGAAGGKCVPQTQVPADVRDKLSQDVCANSALLCVPNENLPGGQGRGCSFVYSGTCISNCVDLGAGQIFPQANCPGNHTCVPCSFAPAGSPGC